MNHRERIIRTVHFQEVDELPFRHAYGLMPNVLESWHEQGLPRSVQTEKQIYEYFGFPTRGKPLPLNVGFDPPFEGKILEDTDAYQIAIDGMGRRTKVLKDYASLPLAMDFPVKDTATWQDYKRRLQFFPERVGKDLKLIASENLGTGHMNGLGVMGFYWFPRDLMGDENLCIAYYEQPELVKDILETWYSLIEQVLNTALMRIRLDSIHFGEDMAYRNASMVSRPIFDEFIKPYYERIHHIVQQHDVPVFSVDTDGCVNELIEWFAECGVNLIGPNEVQAGNDITAYRERFGRKMAYDGGLDKHLLPKGREAIDAMLEHTVPFMKRTGGGWIVCLDHRTVEDTRLADFQYYVDRVRALVEF